MEWKLGFKKKKKSTKLLPFKQNKLLRKFCKDEPYLLHGMPLFSEMIDYSALQMATILILLEKNPQQEELNYGKSDLHWLTKDNSVAESGQMVYCQVWLLSQKLCQIKKMLTLINIFNHLFTSDPSQNCDRHDRVV